MRGDTEGLSPLQSLVDTVKIVDLMNFFRASHKKECTNLVRRIRLLMPLFEEVKEKETSISEEALPSFLALDKALKAAARLLQFCRDGSKLYLLMENDAVSSKFQTVTEELDRALDELPSDLFDISDEVREQVELVHNQLKRAKGRSSSQDVELLVDVMIVVSQDNGNHVDSAVLKRLANKLQLRTHSELKAETMALQNLKEQASYFNKSLDKMEKLLRILKTFAGLENLETLNLNKLSISAGASAETSGLSVIPEDFRCPISLDLMKDPVIVATGQTYERASIQRWLDAGHRTCPKTQQVLCHLVLTPNYVLRSLIAQWCEENGLKFPMQGCDGDLRCGDRAAVDMLLQKISSGQTDVLRAAAGELRVLAKRNAENRVCIAEAGAIPVLVNLLSIQDAKTQEHAVTALLNLSIHDSNKGAIVKAGAIGPIVGVLKYGSMEARENAAATLFSLSVADENKVTIGASGAIPALVDLLRYGSYRGKKDAATALFNLLIYQGNKARAIRAGAVAPLMGLLGDSCTGMVDEALAILALLVTHQEGKKALGNTSAIQALVDLIGTGSPRNKENAAAVLLVLGSSNPSHLIAAKHLGACQSLTELANNGTARAKRKAITLLEHFNGLQPEA